MSEPEKRICVECGKEYIVPKKGKARHLYLCPTCVKVPNRCMICGKIIPDGDGRRGHTYVICKACVPKCKFKIDPKRVYDG